MNLRTLPLFTVVALTMLQAPALAQTNCSILLNYTVLEDVDKKTAADAQTKLVAQGAKATTNCDDDSECSVILPITLKSTLPQTVAASIKQDLEQLGIEAKVNCDSAAGTTAATGGAACTITPQQQSKFNTPIAQLDLSVRLHNSLKAAKVTTLGEIVSKNIADFLQIRNLGKKSLTELEELVASQGLKFGMKTSCP